MTGLSACSVLSWLGWLINRFLRGDGLETRRSQRLDELDQRGSVRGCQAAFVRRHHGLEALHDLPAGVDHRMDELGLVGDHRLAVFENLLLVIKVEPGRADVRLSVEGV